MNNEAIDVLKLFARKLANCRYNVPVTSLIEYMKGDQFGYTRKDGTAPVITNDHVFADDITRVVSHIRSIFSEPHISLKKENIVQNVETATKYDTRSLKETYKDEKLWSVKDGEKSPEYVHAYIHEDDLAIYENRFISFLIDILYDAVSKKIDDICEKLKTINGEIGGYNEFGLTNELGYPSSSYVDYVEKNDGLPVLISANDKTISVISSLVKSKRLLMSLKSSEIYQACRKAGHFDSLNIKFTNILEHDVHYNYCYVFYIKYFNKDVILTTETEMYYNFVTVNLFYAISTLGFTPDEKNENIRVGESSKMKFSPISFSKEPFKISVEQLEHDLVITVTETCDSNFGKYLIKIFPSSQIDRPDKFSITDEHIKNMIENRPSEYVTAFLVTDLPCESKSNTVEILPEISNSLENMRAFLKSLFVMAEGLEYVHSRYCPVCGSTLVSPEYEDYLCINCESLYHIFSYTSRDVIWIKRLPKTTLEEKKGIAENEETVEEVKEDVPFAKEVEQMLEENPQNGDSNDVETDGDGEQEESDSRNSLSKSFIGKVSQLDETKQSYYSEIKNHILFFERTRSNVSWSYDNFFIGRNSAIKIAVRGKTLVAYLALNPKDYEDTKYFPRDVSDIKKYEDTPMMVKIKSERGVKFAKELIDIVLQGLNPKKKFNEEEYKFPYKTDLELLRVKLAKYNGSFVEEDFVFPAEDEVIKSENRENPFKKQTSQVPSDPNKDSEATEKEVSKESLTEKNDTETAENQAADVEENQQSRESQEENPLHHLENAKLIFPTKK